jgi:hypothetical protein
MAITRFDIQSAQLQRKILRELGDPVPEDVEKLANLELPDEPTGDVTRFEILAARAQIHILQGLGEPIDEELERISNMKFPE